MVVEEVEGAVYGTEYISARSGVVEFGLAQLLYLPHQLYCRLLQPLQEEGVPVIRLIVAEEDESQFVAGVVEDLLLEG